MPITLLKFCLLGVLLSLQFALWFGDKNQFDLYRLERTAAQLELQNAQLQKQNDKLLAEVVDLKDGLQTIETLARAELGLIKRNETFYRTLE